MERYGKVKVVYEDEGVTKVLRGSILENDEFTITIKANHTDSIITIGKRAIVKISKEVENGE